MRPAKTRRHRHPPKKAAKVITNEEIPEHAGPAARPSVSDAAYHEAAGIEHSSVGTEGKAEALKSQITSMKNYIASIEGEIENLNNSIHFASGNCVANCVQWNERQIQKQQQVEQMKAQLEDQKKHLEDMQESARQQGFGSSVYDP
jgi:predicted RNase H-like nuclease (RuvC/YqgF family)